MSKIYGWAKNLIKLQRAIAKGGNEQEIKEEYIKMGGAVVPGYEIKEEAPISEEIIKDPVVEEKVQEVKAPIKVAAKKVVKK